MKEQLCQAFCSDLEVHTVGSGLAVGTSFVGVGGNKIGFFIVGPDKDGRFIVQDDGATIPYIEASGADLGVTARQDAFDTLISEYGARYDKETFELKTDALDKVDVPAAAMKFVALLLRVQDLLFMTRERVESTFEEEVKRDLRSAIGSAASIEEDAAISPELTDYPADLVIRAADRKPVAVFFGISDFKVSEALLLHMYAKYSLKIDLTVVAILETDNSIGKRTKQRADNHLIVPRYRGDSAGAIGRIAEAVLGYRPVAGTIH